ncbi:thermostable hemolysin [Enterobacter asburiae]|nr:thermostable hemolysin [Enterobacter asburiae]
MRISPPFTLQWRNGGCEQNDISALIHENYARVYQASLTRCMPWLLGLYNASNQLTGACGVQPASQGTLYLEKYLDTPVETTLSKRLGTPVSRDTIVEIGNFTARDGASVRIMYAGLCLLMTHYHFSWVVFTGTKKIRNTFYRLNLNPVTLIPADPSRLGNAALAWGSYYQHDPQIMAGELAGGYSALSQSSLLLALFNSLPVAPWSAGSGERYVSEGA